MRVKTKGQLRAPDCKQAVELDLFEMWGLNSHEPDLVERQPVLIAAPNAEAAAEYYKTVVNTNAEKCAYMDKKRKVTVLLPGVDYRDE